VVAILTYVLLIQAIGRISIRPIACYR